MTEAVYFNWVCQGQVTIYRYTKKYRIIEYYNEDEWVNSAYTSLNELIDDAFNAKGTIA